MSEVLLGVNIDHIATVRNARGTNYPDPFRRHLSQSRRGRKVSLCICAKTAVISPTVMWNC